LSLLHLLDGPAELRFVVIASPRIAAEGDVAEEELVDVEDRDVVWLFKDDAQHSPDIGIAEDQGVERCAGDSVAVMLNVFDA
jgi:hypothetical protein